MRVGLVAMAIAALCVSASARAATIVQYDNELTSRGFDGFNPQLGQLNRVTLDIALNKSRVWQIDAPISASSTKTVDWVVDGRWSLSSPYLGQTDPISISLVGGGQSMVTLDKTFADRAYGYFTTDATGGATLTLDPFRFVGTRTFFNGYDTGYNDTAGADTTITGVGTSHLFHLAGACYVAPTGPLALSDDECGNARYTLTFDYTPGSVPEPATWALMLSGFGVVGIAMRRRKGKVRNVALT